MFRTYPVIGIIILLIILFSFVGCRSSDVEIYPPVEFKPIPGHFLGASIEDNLEITVVDAQTTDPLKGAHIFIHRGDPLKLIADRISDKDGKASFAGDGFSGKISVTVTGCEAQAYDTISFLNVNSSTMIIPLMLRKSRSKTKTALTFPGLDSGDEKLTYYINDQPKPELDILTNGEKTGVKPDPFIVSVQSKPLAFSAVAKDIAKNTTKFGFSIVPNGPIPVKTPTMLKMNKVNTDSVRAVSGKIEFPPANMDSPSGGWNPSKHCTLGVFSDGGIAGEIFTGFGNITSEYGYQAFCWKTPGIAHLYLQVSAFNRDDSWAESSTTYFQSEVDKLQISCDFAFKDVPKRLHTVDDSGSFYPILKWDPGEGDLDVIIIRQDKYDYNWKIYSKNNFETGSLLLPPLLPGSAGALINGEEYRFQVETWSIKDFQYDSLSFQNIRESITDKVRSEGYQFKVDTN